MSTVVCKGYLRTSLHKAVRQIIGGKVSVLGLHPNYRSHSWAHPVTMHVNNLSRTFYMLGNKDYLAVDARLIFKNCKQNSSQH
jgi:hypothetical protein